jgi:hypothetical protein
MKTIILSYVIALGGVATIVFGIYSLIRERVAELGLRGYVPAIQTIAVGVVLIGLARALQLLLLIFAASLGNPSPSAIRELSFLRKPPPCAGIARWRVSLVIGGEPRKAAFASAPSASSAAVTQPCRMG